MKEKAKSESETQQENQNENTAADCQTEAQGGEDKTENKELTPEEKVSALEEENAELKDQYLRKVADFENYRKRMMREKQETYDYANTALLTDLVAILDDFDRSLVVSQDAKEVSVVVDGIKMINKQMRGFLDSKYNLTSYGEKGDLFDHDIHEAIASEQSDVPEPLCAEVYLKGYKLKDRVIRPAKVLVHMPISAEKE